MYKCGFFALLSVALSVAFSTLFFDVSKAQSEFDNTYHTTNNLILSSPDQQTKYDVTDLPLERLMAGLEDKFEGRNIRYDRFFKSSGSADNITNDEEERERLYDLWIKAEEWTINQVEMPNGEDFVEYCFTSGENTERKLSVNFEQGNDPIWWGGKAARMGRNDVANNDQNRVYRVTFRLSAQQYNRLTIRYEFASNAIDRCVISTENRDRNITTQSGVRSNFVTSIDQINYPDDYLGKDIRDTFNPLQNPTFTADVEGYTVKLKDTTPLSAKQTSKIDLCMFQVPTNPYGDSFTEYTYDCEDPPEIEHEFSESGTYRVILRLYSSAEDTWYDHTESVVIETASLGFSYRIDNYDAYLQDITPAGVLNDYNVDLCMFQVPNNPHGDNFTEYTYDCEQKPEVHHTFDQYAVYNIIMRYYSSEDDRWFDIALALNVDGSSYEGSIGGVPTAIYEDCDLIDILCHFRNAWVGLTELFKYLFVPQWRDVRPYFNNFTHAAGNQLGFLYDSFAMLGSAFNLVIATGNPNVGYTCNIPLTFFGRTGNVQLCAWRYQNPDMWALMQRSIQAGISLTLVYVFWRKFNKMTGRDVEDGTEIEATGSAHPAQHLDWVNERTGERGKIK